MKSRTERTPGLATLHATYRKHGGRSIMDRVDRAGDCWDWTGATDLLGYGIVGVDRRVWKLHVLLYTVLVGPVPDGLELDHLCKRPVCCFPGHMEAVTHGENVRRGLAGHKNRTKTHCPQGHPYSGDNLYTNGTNRQCLICKRINGRKSDAKRRPPRGPITHCPRGHPYSGDNLYVNPNSNKRSCRACHREWQRQFRAHNRAERESQ